MKKVLLFSLGFLSLLTGLRAQVCTATSFDVDLSSSIDTTVVFQSQRNGNCCSGTNCIRFNLTLNPACSYVNFNVQNPAPPGNAAFYQVDCGPAQSLGTPICIVGKTNVVITFCKPGNDNPIYTITAAGAIKGSDDITVREGCTGTMNVSGLLSGITWTSIYPGARGAYNSWLNCTTGCTSVNVVPQVGAPPYVDFQVTGSRLCGPPVSDTIRVFTTPQISVSITPNNAAVCASGSTSATLTATATGGDEPYSFVWSNAQTGNSITVNTGNTYSVSVTDARNCLPASNSVVVATTPLPLAPTLSSNSPLCEGTDLQLFASSVPGATYSWTGPAGFTSNQQNPVINNVASANAGTYSVTITVGQCSSLPATIGVVVKAIPASPTVGRNSPVCQAATLSLTASNIPSATFNWTGPNGFTSSAQNPSIINVPVAAGGTYSVTATVNGCSSQPSTIAATINPLPPAPVITATSPLCQGNTLSLSASDITGATYNWTGPGGFTSAVQNPVINNAAVSASGTYSVKATVNACTGPSSSFAVVVNPIPSAPVVLSNSPVCEGANLNLTSSSIAGAIYSWTGPNGFTSSVQNPALNAVTLSDASTYSLVATVNGCASPAANLQVTVNPIPSAPTISGNTNICAGTSLSLSASPINLAIYHWQGPNSYSSNLQSILIGNAIPSQSGQYLVTASVNGCTSLPTTATVLINSLPIAPTIVTNSPLCSGNSLNLSVQPVAGAAYSWTGPNGFTSSVQNPVIPNAAMTDAGNYQLNVLVNGCQSASPTSTNVVVKQTPAAPVLNTNSPVCEGTSLSLSASNVPGGAFSWTGPNGFSSSIQNPSLNNAAVANSGTYSATVTVNGCSSTASTIAATINPLPVAPSISSNSPICQASALSLTASDIAGATYSWTGPVGFTSSLQNPVINNANIVASGTYSVKATVNGCTGAASSLTAVVNPIPSAPVLSSSVPVCEGSCLNLMASNIPGSVYSWSGPNGFTSSIQNPSLPSATVNASGTYSAFVTVNGCSSPATTVQATVNPIPAMPVVSGTTTVCEGTTLNLSASPVASASYSWQGPNGFSSASQAIAITYINPLQAGQYIVTTTVNGCTSPSAITNVQVNRLPVAPSILTNSPVCSGTTLNLSAQNITGATYNWAGPNGFVSSSQNPIITNTAITDAGDYQLSVSVNGCQSASPSSATVIVRQTPTPPAVANNSPLCEGSNLNLSATGVAGTSYSWTGPNGFISSVQNPILSNVISTQGGNYVATVSLNGCTSPAATTSAIIDRPVLLNAGADQLVCSSTAAVSLLGSATNGGSGLWTSDGNGTFSAASNTSSVYVPSATDKQASSVMLHFTSTNNGSCPASTSSMTVRFAAPPSADAGADQMVCANNANVSLTGKYSNANGGIWTSSGNGSFQPAATSANATYVPGSKEKTEGSVQLTWTTTGNGPCPAASDKMIVAIKQPPAITVDKTWYAYENNGVVLKPTISGSQLKYSWTPATFLNSDTVANPLCTPKSNVSYKLMAQDAFGCAAAADLNVKLIRNPVVPNVFTPNGDGVNDTWQVKNLAEYNDCVLNIYNRYGQVVYQCKGYARDWDGSSNGKPLPAGTYYYVIDLKINVKPLSGFVDILR
jgi:gliding motility-associated-like protein